ncbi:hypothetical protein PRIC2_003087 [Phytophthora ramorum]
MSLRSLDDEADDAVEDNEDMALIWDLSNRNTVQEVRKEAVELVEDEEDEEAFGSAKEDANDDDDDNNDVDQESKEHVAQSEEFTLDDSRNCLQDLPRTHTRPWMTSDAKTRGSSETRSWTAPQRSRIPS